MSRVLITNLIEQFREVIDGDLWIDENFKKKFNRISGKEALLRPLPQLFSVAELISHILIWRRQLLKRLSVRDLVSRADVPNYWKNNDELRKTGWKKLKEEFYESQFELIRLLENKNDAFLNKKYSNSGYSNKYIIVGLIHHDLYHLGQIGIAIKLLKERK